MYACMYESSGTTLWRDVLFKHFVSACVNVLVLRYVPYQKYVVVFVLFFCLFFYKEIGISVDSTVINVT